MRLVVGLLVIAYLVGIGVTLAPTIKANWNTVPASQFVEGVATELPKALAWPVTAYRTIGAGLVSSIARLSTDRLPERIVLMEQLGGGSCVVMSTESRLEPLNRCRSNYRN